MTPEKARQIAERILDELRRLLANRGIAVPSADHGDRECRELEDAILDILMQEVEEDGATWVIQERQKGDERWQTMQLSRSDCTMSRQGAERAAERLRGHFSGEFEYRVVEKGDA